MNAGTDRSGAIGLGRYLFRFAIVTDTHFSEEDGVSSSPWPSNKLANARALHVFDRIEAAAPAFVLHLGDMVHPVPAQTSFRASARKFHDAAARISCPIHLTPGNHDIGDKPVEWAPAGKIQPEYVAQYEDVFGPSYYAFSSNDCCFIVLNASLLNSGLDQEDAQNRWLEDELTKAAGQRTFLSIHYPLYVHSPDEDGSYDNIDEPARSLLLGMIGRFGPEAVFSGHVHNFWYDRIGVTQFYVLPATSFVRQDYSEMYRVGAGPENGRDDAAKLGYAVVDVYEHGHVLGVERSYGLGVAGAASFRSVSNPATRLHTRTNTLPALGVDLRHPWANSIEIPANGGVDEFARKFARNDYPLLAIWEMGIRNLRVPIQDFVDPRTRHRMQLMTSLGNRFTAFSFGLPDGRAFDAIVNRSGNLDAVEIILGRPVDAEMQARLVHFREKTGIPIFLSKMRRGHAQIGTNVYAHSIQHGFTTDELTDPEKMFGGAAVAALMDGIVVRVSRSDSVGDHIEKARSWSNHHGLRARAMVRLAGDNPAGREEDDEANAVRVAESALAGILSRDVEVFFDTFDDVDRGYFATNGLVDRRYNPRPAGVVLKNLQTALLEIGDDLNGMRPAWFGNGRMRLCGASEKTMIILAVRGEGLERLIQDGWSAARVDAIDLETGEKMDHPQFAKSLTALVLRKSQHLCDMVGNAAG